MNESSPSPILEVELSSPEPSKGEREYQAFLRLLPELLKTYQGRHVAIHEGRLVDSDSDDIALIKRVHAQVGYVPIYVGMVAEQLPIIRVPHFLVAMS